MKDSLEYVNTNVECGLNFSNNTKECKLHYIEHLPKTQFRRG